MRTKLALVIAALVLLALAAPAGAKGPSDGTIEGDGLKKPIAIGQGEGTSGGDRLIEDIGFFDATFGMIPSQMLDAPPTRDLGPMLTVRWNVPGPEGDTSVIVQQLYPYADIGPVVHTDPGQVFFVNEHAKGGWFRAPERLVTTLQSMGLPSADALGPGSASHGGTSWSPIAASIGAAVLGIGTIAALARRRREVAPAAG